MHTIDFINEYGLEALETELGILVHRYPDRIVLNYSQIDSLKYHPVADECRGLILNYNGCGWHVLSRAFDRFYNLGRVPQSQREEQMRIVEHPDSVITEKVDGSIVSIYHDGDQWRAATRKMAYAEGETVRGNTFKDVFERAIGCSLNERFKNCGKNLTIIFELVSPETRVVHPYPKDDIYMLGIRDKVTGEELSWAAVQSFAETNGFKTPKTYQFNTVEEILNSAKELPTLEEGYVCRLDTRDGVKRIKMKNPKYVAIAHLRDNGVVSDKRIVMLVIAKGYDEYLKHFPEDHELFDPYIVAFGRMHEMIQDLMVHVSIKDQKVFALKVKDTPVSGIMFMVRKGISVQDALDRMTDDNKARMLGVLRER